MGDFIGMFALCRVSDGAGDALRIKMHAAQAFFKPGPLRG
jgi:hypothetical protein